MNKILLLLFISVLSLVSTRSFSQETQGDFAPFLARTVKKATLKAKANSASKTKLNLPLGSQLYAFSETDIDGYIRVIDIRTNKLGYIRKTAAKKVKDLPLSQSNSFEENGQSSSINPEVVIKNTTSMTISLIVGVKYFSLSPHTTITKIIDSGDLPYTASAPLVVPLSGRHYFKLGDKYSWTFTIRTIYR
jgi:hypothetical protein